MLPMQSLSRALCSFSVACVASGALLLTKEEERGESTRIPRNRDGPSSLFPALPFLARAHAAEPSPSTTGFSASATVAPPRGEKDAEPLTRGTFIRAAQAISPSVVHIDLRHDAHRGFFSAFDFGGSAGSGFIVSEDGVCLTNAHVIKSAYQGKRRGDPPRDRIVVTLEDGRTFGAKVLYLDEASDCAAIKIEDATGIKFPAATLGSSATLRAGDFIMAVGSPYMLQVGV